MAAGFKLQVMKLFSRPCPQLLEALDLRLGKGLEGQVRQCGAPPSASASRKSLPLPHGLLEAVCVDLLAVELEHVAGRPRN